MKVPLVLGGAFGIALGLGRYTVRYAEALSYLSDDPSACVNCHIMREQYEGWLKGPHAAVATCNDCQAAAVRAGGVPLAPSRLPACLCASAAPCLR